MSKKKSLPTVALQSVFVRDHQRRLRLVIELLEKEARRQSTPPTNLQSHTKNARAEMIEELVWQAVSELLRNPQILIDQYNQRQESDYGTPEQQGQQRTAAALSRFLFSRKSIV